jgi:putative endonuclease
VVFVEVKLRRQLKYGHPKESIHELKQSRIKNTALFYIAKHELHDQDFRFDAVTIYDENGRYCIEHIENAFW